MYQNQYIKTLTGKNSNFKFEEFTKSKVAIRNDIKNEPNETQWDNIIDLVQNVLQPLRDEFGPIKINSGYRSPYLNKLIGGSIHSNHMNGESADIIPLNKDISLLEIMRFINYKLPFRELIAEFFPDGWVHVTYRKHENTRKIMLKDKTHNYYRCDMKYILNVYERG